MTTTQPDINLQFSCLSSKATAQVIETYISAKVDDDVEVLKVKMLEKGTAFVVVKGMTDVDGFVSQRHKIGGTLVEVSIVDPPKADNDVDEEDYNDLDSASSTQLDIIPDLIEVTCDKEIDTEMLEMYFQGRKSGGKREKEVESVDEIESCVYHVKFESEEDAAVVVAQAKHVLGKTKLSVQYVPAPVPKEYDKDKLIVKDIPSGADEEYFVTFIEGRLGLENEDDFNIDFRKTCAIIMFTEEYSDEELDQMIQKLMKKKIRKQVLSVERCEVNCSIVIKSITKKNFANEDALEMYFEQRKSGGGEDAIESISMLGKDSAKVTFTSPLVVSEVLKCAANHKKKLGPEVTMSVCTPLDSFDLPSDKDKSSSSESDTSSVNDDDEKSCRETKAKCIPSSSEDESEVTKKKNKSSNKENGHASKKSSKKKKSKSRKKKSKKSTTDTSENGEETEESEDISSHNIVLHDPVVMPLDPMIAKYLKQTPTLIDELSNDVQVSLSVDEKVGITLSQNEFSPQNWPAVVPEKVQNLLFDTVCKTDIHVPSEGAGEIYPIIIGNCAREGLHYALGQGDNKVYVTGKSELVMKLKNDVEELCSRMIRKAEAIKVSEEDYMFLKAITFTSIQKDYPSVQLKCVDIDNSLSAIGSLRDVGMLKQNLPKYISHSKSPVGLQPIGNEFPKPKIGKAPAFLQELLEELLKSTKCVPYFVQDSNGGPSNLYILSPKEEAYEAERLAMKVVDSIKMQKLSLPQQFASSIANKQTYCNFRDDLIKRIPHLPIVKNTELTVISRTRVSASVLEAYNTFINDECSVFDSFRFKKGVWRLLQTPHANKMWTDVTGELKKIGVTVVSSSKPTARKPLLKIKGMSESIAFAKEKLMDLQHSIIELDIPIVRPGVCRYFFNDPNGRMIIAGVENQANVCIEMNVKEDEESDSMHTNSSAPEFVRVCFGNTTEMKSVNVYVGDITEFNRAEVIVNAANDRLKHGSGVAQAIEMKGGSQIRQDSEKYVRTRGSVGVGTAVLFPRVGNLPPPYKAIVHAVGPTWTQQNEREKALLKRAVYASLMQAKDYNSIAIPAISGGLFGFPRDVCALALMEAVKKFSSDARNALLNEINFIVFQDNVEAFVSSAKRVFNNIHCHTDTVPNQPATITQNTSSAQTGRRRRRTGSTTPQSFATVTSASSNSTNNSLPVPPTQIAKKNQFSRAVMQKIKITHGDIMKNLEDAIVNPTDQQFSFNGYVATALKKGAGPGLEEECESTPTPLQIGEVVTTGAHSLSAQYILHIVLPKYTDEPNSEKILSDVIIKCLDECSRLGLKSISIPSVGAGNLEFPHDVVAKILLETAAEYIDRNQSKSLQLVHFVIFDKKIHQQFTKFHSSLLASAAGTMPTSSQTSFSYGQQGYTPDESQSCKFTLPNNLSLEVVQGDITNASDDVIVNTTNPQLRLMGRGVAGALLKKAGPALQTACDKLVSQKFKLSEGSVIDTPCANMGSLRCRSIFHIVFSIEKKEKLDQTIYACLERAEKMRFRSIAFPAIGTGQGSYAPHDAANAVVNALKKFTSKRAPKYLNVIRIVLYQPQHYAQFVDAFKKMESSSGGFLKRMFNAVGSYLGFGDEEEGDIETNQEFTENNNQEMEEWEDISEQNIFANLSKELEVIISIYGTSQRSVGMAEKILRANIDTQFVTEEIDDMNIRSLFDSSVRKLEEFANSHHVDIEIERDEFLHFIKLHGCQKDVLAVKDKVRDELASFSQNLVMKEAAEAMSKHIRWIRIIDEGDTQEYDEVFTYEIEKAFQRKDSKYISSDDTEKFEVSFSNMEEKDLVTGEVLKVKRVDLLEEEKPSTWDQMPTTSSGKEVTVHLVTLSPNNEEYVDALKRFHVTMAQGKHYTKIHSIQRLQNPILYGQYMARKKEMDRRNPTGHENEKWLFHGTKHTVLDDINANGFNRSYRGVNGTVYGQGVYFARDSYYSNRYAKADGNGVKYMYLTRVLTGEYTVGDTSMIVPPPKDPNFSKHVLFDSTVDNQGSPSIFVVYYDSQNYPAYLIKYQ